MDFFSKIFKAIFGGLFKQPKIVIPAVPPPPTPPPPPRLEESAAPISSGTSATDAVRRTRLGRRRFVTNAALGIPTISGSGMGIPGGQV